ncbi:amidohydrolase family protein, partial [Burkholderia sp. Ac-20353]|uniref:amidohydrolase family protein n=1 Tax=Burkholderia sp. Ac-20353 TaxID=2703894 RepID=UPI00197BB088
MRNGSPPDGFPDALVDAHHHLWRLDASAHYPWLQDRYDPARFMFGDYAALCRDFGVDDYRRAAEGAPIVASVHVEAERARDEALAETRWLHDIAAAHGLPSAIVAWVDLLADDAAQRIAEQAAWPRVRGVRFKPRTAPAPDAAV